MKFSKRISIIFVTGFLFISSVSAAEDYWQRLQKKADSMHDGWDVTVSVNTGVEHREYF